MREYYDSILKTIELLTKVDDIYLKDCGTLMAFIDYFNQKKVDVLAFCQVEKELMQKLDDYDFAEGLGFEALCAYLKSIGDLRLKLFNMNKEALKLSAYPDCYDLKKTINDCRELLSFCSNAMSFSEVEKASESAVSLTQKLNSIQIMMLKGIDTLRAKLLERSPEVWKEDAQRILAGVTALSKGDGDYSIVHLQNEYSNARNRRINDINETIKQYPWLEKNNQKKRSHDFILIKQMSFADYRLAIEKLRKDRRGERIAIWFGSSFILLIVIVKVLSNI